MTPRVHASGASSVRVRRLRVVVTAAQVVHKMRADVLEMSLGQNVQVAAIFNSGRLDLHPGGIDPARLPLVTREVAGDEIAWQHAAFNVTTRKVEPE